MKRVVLSLVATAALLSAANTAMAYGPYYRPGFRVGVYSGYAPYYPRPYYYGPRYYPPPAYYYPPPVYARPPVIYGPGPGVSFSFGR